jgi:hypothetical protein
LVHRPNQTSTSHMLKQHIIFLFFYIFYSTQVKSIHEYNRKKLCPSDFYSNKTSHGGSFLGMWARSYPNLPNFQKSPSIKTDVA